jgi:trehalose-phosphatase
MSETTPYRAVISDMDGVITRTASVHQAAWREMFDAFLESRDGREGEDLAAFTDADYREHLDGKPRLDGVRDFLASRGIALPEGDEDDGPDADTVWGLGRRKNELFNRVLDRDGVEVFTDTVAAFDRWQRGGLPVAAISSSRNCRKVLAAAGQLERFEAVVGGEVAATEGLNGKPDLIAHAARQLGVDPARCVLLEDATSGVRAGREAGCGLVVGVDRVGGDHPADLEANGAHRVETDLAALRFPRNLPTLAAAGTDLGELRQGRPLCVFLDFDGTLSPIVDDPDAASISADMRAALRRLAARHTVAVVSGRDRADVQARARLEGIFYAGSHGLDIAGPGREMAHPEAEAAVPEVEAAERLLRERVGDLEGAVIERKRFSVAAHYRMVDPGRADEVVQAAAEALQRFERLQARRGKKVVELVPAIDWDKGRAVRWLLDALDVDPERSLVLYLGDDETDEDAFLALAGLGVGFHVGPAVSDTRADFRLADPDAVLRFLGALVGVD